MRPKYQRCIVPLCFQNSLNNPEQYFVKFPKVGTNKYYKWCEVLNITRKTSNCFVCLEHFNSKSYNGNGELKTSAVPCALELEDMIMKPVIKTYRNRKCKFVRDVPGKIVKNSDRCKEIEIKPLPLDVEMLQKKIAKQLKKNEDEVPDYLYVCNICYKPFILEHVLKQHMNRHFNDKRFKCRWKNCSKSFRNLHLLNDHYNIHSSEKPYECLKCGQVFSTAFSLAKHGKRICNIREIKLESDADILVIEDSNSSIDSLNKAVKLEALENVHPSDTLYVCKEEMDLVD